MIVSLSDDEQACFRGNWTLCQTSSEESVIKFSLGFSYIGIVV